MALPYFPLIYLLILVGWLILVIGFYRRDYAITSLASIFLVMMGIYILINGIESTVNFTTESFGLIHLCVGMYVLIRGSVELIQNNM